MDYNNNESQKIIEEALRILDRPKITLVDVATQYEEVHDMADLNNNSTPKLVKILKIIQDFIINVILFIFFFILATIVLETYHIF